LRHVSGTFIEEINKLTHNLRHGSGAFMEEINKMYAQFEPMNVPDTCLKLCLHLIYFFNERFRPPASNCAYILFISSMNAPDTCLKLCVNLFISSMNVPDTCFKLCRYIKA
jgi:hypothetical protein